jgi:hypothetical protein
VSPDLESGAEPNLRIKNGHGHSPLIARRHPSTTKHGCGTRTGTIDNDGLETLSGELTQSDFRVRAVLNSDVEIPEGSAKDPYDLIVRTKQQRLQIHDAVLNPSSSVVIALARSRCSAAPQGGFEIGTQP